MSPSPFIVEWIDRLGAPHGRRALDVAMGRGRHALHLAAAGYKTFGVDISIDAVRGGVESAAAAHLTLHAWCADLTRIVLPDARFDLVVVTRYLQRDLVPAIRTTVAPHGVVLYETFTTAQRALGRGPTSPDHLLEPLELRRLFSDLEILFYEEVTEPEAVARIAARRIGTS